MWCTIRSWVKSTAVFLGVITVDSLGGNTSSHCEIQTSMLQIWYGGPTGVEVIARVKCAGNLSPLGCLCQRPLQFYHGTYFMSVAMQYIYCSGHGTFASSR